MPPRRAVELRVGGQTYRVVATDDDPHVQHLAGLVDRKFADVVPQGVGRSMTAHQAMFLTAMALAAEVEEQRHRAERLEGERDRSLRLAARAREVVGRLLQRVDSALAPARTADSGAPRPRADSTPARPSADPSNDARPSLPQDTHPRVTSPLDSPEPIPVIASTPPFEQDSDATVPRAPRAGLRLVRRSTPTDDDSH